MRKICCLICVCFILVLCACGDNVEEYHYDKNDVNEELNEAKKLFDDGKIEDSLVIYLDAMKKEPKNVEARIGVIKCQIELENYSMAISELGLAIELDPKKIDLYNLYVEISNLTENISYAQTAVNLAKQYNVEEFLNKVPQKPNVNYESGNYDKRLYIELEAENIDSEIYFNVYKENQYSYRQLVYDKPWLVTSGETQINAYCVKDGIPSETVEVNYTCEYPATEVHFEEPLMEQLIRNELGKENGEITDLDCEQISSLHISDYYLRTEDMDYEEYSKLQFSTLNDLHYFPNLTYIYMNRQTEISDFSPIGECWKVYSVDLNGCNVKEIDFIANLPNLTQLYLNNNNISDITPILECDQIRYLDISKNPIGNASEITVLENLSSLGFSTEQFEDMSIISQFDDLVEIDVYWKDEAELIELSKLMDIERLSIEYDIEDEEPYYNRKFLTDISFIADMRKLSYLRIDGLEDMSLAKCLKTLTNLENLYLYNRDSYDSESDDAVAVELQNALPNCNISY